LKHGKDGKFTHMLTFLGMFTVLTPLEFNSVSINFWCCLTNSIGLIISSKTLINMSALHILFQFFSNILIKIFAILTTYLKSVTLYYNGVAQI